MPRPEPAALREAMVDAIAAKRALIDMPPLPPQVEKALRTVPRHPFLPGLDLGEAYADQAVVTSRDDDKGVALSSVSAPSIVATMLDRADLAPGMRVLEVGSGGYNAALISHLVGPAGEVTSLDIDPEVIDRARACLEQNGTPGVRLVVGDGEHAFPERAPYDRIIVTAGAWDVPPAWGSQLADGGRLVIPVRIRGLTRLLTLQPAPGGRWKSVALDMCGFVRMQGAGEHWEPMVTLHDADGAQAGLRLEDGPHADAEALRAALAAPGVEAWSGVHVGAQEPTDAKDLWIASAADGWAQLTAQRGAVKNKVVRPMVLMGTPALVSEEGTSFAYRLLRPHPELENRWEFGALGHGPQGAATAERLCALIAQWDAEHRGGPGPRITLYPASTPARDLPPGRVVTKRHVHMVLDWTTAPHK
ncbi:methyltransferase, FxLD system [Nocardiopsis sp. LOL_012]|uniref:methyltransferase, FxLD system n=1 Tax=Nocardiopsis sp. LOL_012 TaxID=3345409 RepID=UPI003A8551C4